MRGAAAFPLAPASTTQALAHTMLYLSTFFASQVAPMLPLRLGHKGKSKIDAKSVKIRPTWSETKRAKHILILLIYFPHNLLTLRLRLLRLLLPGLPRSSRPFASFLPSFCLVPPVLLTRSSRPFASLLPSCCLAPFVLLPRSFRPVASFLPSCCLVPPAGLPRSSRRVDSFLPSF